MKVLLDTNICIYIIKHLALLRNHGTAFPYVQDQN
ncbi:MAG: type II toxin-antitoxin system VapC family toxin [Nitrospirae bacterium]|nr:MAG: type II toxin-antitoxin system VapC family toxin [Nitrospirota bacterium]